MDYAKTGILFAAMLSLLVTPVIMEDAFAAERIPGFMKKNIEWYATGQISEDEFVNALTYLMNIDVIVLEQGRADAIKELREENKQLRIALEQCQQACGTDSGVGFDSSAGAGISASAGDSGTSAGAGFKAGAGMSASAGVSPSTETTESHQLGPEVIQKKHITNLGVDYYRVTDESTNNELLIALPTTSSGDVGDAYFLAALAAVAGTDPSILEEMIARDPSIDVTALVQWALRQSYLEQTEDLRFHADKVKFYNDQKAAIRDHLTELRQYQSTLSEYEAKVSSPTTGTSAYSQVRELPVGTGEPSPVVSQGLDSLEKENESTMTEFSTLQKRYAVAENEVFDIAQQIQENLDAKKQLRADIAELRDIITNDSWPAKFSYHDENGNEVAVVLSTLDEAKALLEKLEQSLQTLSDISQMMQLELQDAMNKQQQAMQILSNIMKNQHDTLKAIIQNMRG